VGRAKEYWLEQQERGYNAVDGHICADCVSDSHLEAWINANASANECSFCGATSKKPIAADFEDFVGVVVSGIRFDWNDPDDEGIMFVSADGGYQADLTSTWDILGDYGVTDNSDVFDALLDSINNTNWVDRDYYIGDDSQRLVWGWEHFKSKIKHETRYFFSKPEDGESDRFSPEIPPSEMLSVIGGMITSQLDDYDLLAELPAQSTLYRVRIDDMAHDRAKDIGTPPPEYARQSNRMSPAGIPMFYAAFDQKTAISETYDPVDHSGQTMSIGTFKPLRPLRVLNLADLPNVPSVFDEEGRHLIHPLRFLGSFAADVAKPIARDGREHIEYVPTQVVTEYFRRVYRTPDGDRLDGIIYRSSRRKGRNAAVFFFENRHCVDEKKENPKGATLQLTAVCHEVCK
jgi:Zn ribbon nucleic-acid-binding protein